MTAARRIRRGKLLFSARVIPYRGSWLDFEFDPKDILYFRVDRRRKMPATILLKAIGLSNEQVLAHFFRFDTFQVAAEGGFMELVPERLRGEIARFDITDKTGKVMVAEGQAHQRQAHPRHGSRGHEAHRRDRGLPAGPRPGEQRGRSGDRRDRRQRERRADRGDAEEAARRQRPGDPHDLHERPGPGPVHLQHAAHRRDRRPAGGADRDLPDDAAGRAADRRRRRDAVPAPVLRRRDLRPVARRPHEGQLPLRSSGNHRPDDAEQRGHHRHDEAPRRAAQRPRRNRRHRSPRQPPRALRRANWPRTSSAPAWCASSARSRNALARPRPRT